MFKRYLMLSLLALLEGGDNMVELFATLIIAGTRTFAQVPVSLQPAVHQVLLDLGLNDDGTPIVG